MGQLYNWHGRSADHLLLAATVAFSAFHRKENTCNIIETWRLVNRFGQQAARRKWITVSQTNWKHTSIFSGSPPAFHHFLLLLNTLPKDDPHRPLVKLWKVEKAKKRLINLTKRINELKLAYVRRCSSISWTTDSIRSSCCASWQIAWRMHDFPV